MAGAGMIQCESGPHSHVAHWVMDSASQKQRAALIECLAENDPGFAQILVDLRFLHPIA